MRTAVATIVSGDLFERILKITGPRMAWYAATIGAEFLVLDVTEHKLPHFAKFDLLSHVVELGFERLLYLDADILVKRFVPDIFEHYESAAFSEVPHPRADWLAKSTTWIRKNLDEQWPLDRYYNTGVLVIGGQELRTLAEATVNVNRKPGVYFEQDQLNVIMRDVGFPRQNLAQEWNQFASQPWITPEKSGQSHFLHCTGVENKDKYKLIETLSKVYP